MLTAVGRELGPSDWLRLDAERLRMFSHATYMAEDDDVDLTVSHNNQLGPELLDGFMLLSLVMRFNWNLFPFRDEGTWALNYGVDRVRFTSPVYVGERVRARMEITDASEREAGQFLVRTHTVMEVEGREKPAMVADWLCLYLPAEEAA